MTQSQRVLQRKLTRQGSVVAQIVHAHFNILLLNLSTSFLFYVFQVVFAGDAAVGKTSFINRITKGVFIQDVSSTLGVDFQIKVCNKLFQVGVSKHYALATRKFRFSDYSALFRQVFGRIWAIFLQLFGRYFAKKILGNLPFVIFFWQIISFG